MLLVHLGIALHSFVVQALGDFTKLGNCLLVKFLIRHGHGSLQRAKSSIKSVPGVFAALAGLVVLVHLAFVIFVAGGGLIAARWPRAAWAHLPAAAWGVYIEFSGGMCPLTPLENTLRARAGLEYYSGDFVARYLFPILYPDGLTREAQVVVGLAVLALNAGLYAFVYVNKRYRRR